MKKKQDKLVLSQEQSIKESIISRFNIEKSLVDKILQKIGNDYNELVSSNYNVSSIYDNPVLLYKTILSICLNCEFDKDRLKEIPSNDDYICNVSLRVVVQMIYSNIDSTSFSMSNTITHPVIIAILSLAGILKLRTKYDCDILDKKYHKNFSPIFVLLKEAMESLEGILLLVANKSYSQAMTVYRLYLEQIITAIALMKNYNLIDKYFEFQNLTIKYARNTSDPDVLKVIEEKNIPARDVKSFLNYGWIEYMDGFDQLPKRRYSIKVMAKLSNMDNVYEIYSDSTNYVHMNFLYADISWVNEVNKLIENLYATMIGIIINYKRFTGFDFVYKNIDMANEIETIFTEYEKILSDGDYSHDIFRLKSA